MGTVLIEEGRFAQAAPVLQHALSLSADPGGGAYPFILQPRTSAVERR
jgi:hypothetical protein